MALNYTGVLAPLKRLDIIIDIIIAVFILERKLSAISNTWA